MIRNFFKEELERREKLPKKENGIKVIPDNSEDKEIAAQYEKILNHLMDSPEVKAELQKEARKIYQLEAQDKD